MKKAATCTVALASLVLTTGPSGQALSQGARPSLSFEFFRDKVEPVFLKKREGHARCYACHSTNNAPFHVVKLTPGATTWNEQQSRQNFELVQKVVQPGYIDSPLVKHPLAEEAGGDAHHGGAQQFTSKDDPDWQTLRAFVMGEGK
jgi:hypothetical protein